MQVPERSVLFGRRFSLYFAALFLCLASSGNGFQFLNQPLDVSRDFANLQKIRKDRVEEVQAKAPPDVQSIPDPVRGNRV
jgi:hypothetical protein